MGLAHDILLSMAHRNWLALILLTCPFLLFGGKLQNGPMLGYASMAEVLIWVQTDSPATVHIHYWDIENPDKVLQTDPIQTRKATAYVAKCIADQVREGTRYAYEVYIDSEKVEPQFREGFAEGAIPMTFETPPNWRFRESGHVVQDFTVGFGSCAYVNEPEGGYDRMNSKPYGQDYQIFESIYTVDPDFFIWLGDNVYYREPDWTTRTGMIHRWTHDRSLPELRPMLANIPQYATWDDHDYGPNDIGRVYWNKAEATEIFSLFNGNPTAGLPELPGIFTYFAWGDVHFYLTDNRTYRTLSVEKANSEPYGYKPQMLGKEQIDWMVDLMKYHRWQSRSSYPCSFHVVATGNPVLSPYDKDSLSRFPDEWQYLFDRLVEEEIHNVIFISGDVHTSEASRMVYIGGGQAGVPGKAGQKDKEYIFWDITSSPLTAGPWAGAPASENPYRVDIFPGEPDRYGKRNFATLSFQGEMHNRQAVIRYYDSDGNLLNQDPEKAPGETTDASIIQSRELILNRDPYK
ncbi:MAG: alkaline phosphatase [Puniceicoccaceae bacterium]